MIRLLSPDDPDRLAKEPIELHSPDVPLRIHVGLDHAQLVADPDVLDLRRADGLEQTGSRGSRTRRRRQSGSHVQENRDVQGSGGAPCSRPSELVDAGAVGKPAMVLEELTPENRCQVGCLRIDGSQVIHFSVVGPVVEGLQGGAPRSHRPQPARACRR